MAAIHGPILGAASGVKSGVDMYVKKSKGEGSHGGMKNVPNTTLTFENSPATLCTCSHPNVKPADQLLRPFLEARMEIVSYNSENNELYLFIR